MAYVKCIYGSSDTPSPTPSTKRQGINVYRSNTNNDGTATSFYDPNSDFCANYPSTGSIWCTDFKFYLGGYLVTGAYNGQYATLSVTIDGTTSTISFSSPGANYSTYICDVRYVDRNIAMICYANTTASYDTATNARYIKLSSTGTLIQSTNFGICPAQTATMTYRSVINRRLYDSTRGISCYCMKSYVTDSTAACSLYLNYFYYIFGTGAVTNTSSTAVVGSGYGDIMKATKYDVSVYNHYTGATATNPRLIIRHGSLANGTIYFNIDAAYANYRTADVLNDGHYVMYKYGHIIIVDIKTINSTTGTFDVVGTYNIITDSTHDTFDFLVVSLVNNVVTFYINSTKTILGESKPKGFYRVKFTPNSSGTYNVELLDDFAETYIGCNPDKFHPMYWGPDSDPFNGVFIYDIDE